MRKGTYVLYDEDQALALHEEAMAYGFEESQFVIIGDDKAYCVKVK